LEAVEFTLETGDEEFEQGAEVLTFDVQIERAS
jgi:hypothetical protein